MILIEEFLNLIYNIEPVAIILAIGGLVLIIAGFIHAFYAPFVVIGSLMCSACVFVRFAGGGSVCQLFIICFFMLLIIMVSYILVIRASKYNWILRDPVIDSKNSD